MGSPFWSLLRPSYARSVISIVSPGFAYAHVAAGFPASTAPAFGQGLLALDAKMRTPF
jgi:hypothetical protein